MCLGDKTARDVEMTEEELAEKAARKAARKAAKLAAAEAAEVAAVEPEDETKEERKARKKAAKAAELATAAEDAAKDERRALKAAKKAQLAKEEAEQSRLESPVKELKNEKKRGATDDDGAAPVKKLKGEAGVAVLGAAAFRKAHEIIVPLDCPDPFETFAAACPSFGTAVEKALLAQGYAAPTPIQAQAWPIALQGRDIVAVAATGSGKTCGFLMPAIGRIAERGAQQPPSRWGKPPPARPTVLVMAPTRELAQQIAVEADKFGPSVKARTVCIFGGVPKGDQCRELRQGCDILIATPGRLIDLCTGIPERGLPPSVDLSGVNYLVLDEADRMLDMGFEEDIRKIIEMCPKTGEPEQGGGATGPKAGTMRQTLFFTATWPKDVQRTAASFTSAKAVQVRIGQGAGGDKLTANTRVKQVVTVCDEHEKFKLLTDCLAAELKDGETAIVFAGMKATCDKLEKDLRAAKVGCWCKAIHSGKEQWERDGALQEYRDITAGKNGAKGVMIATDVAARGLDIPGVSMVVVYDFGGKNGAESYVHRIGRTGRAGKTGRAFTFFDRKDHGAYPLVELLKGAKMDVPDELENLAWYDWNKQQKKKSFGKGKGKGKGGKGKSFGGKGKGAGRGW